MVKGQTFHGRLAVVLAGELANKTCVVAAFVWLARRLQPAAYGEVEWALSLTMVATLAADAGLATWATARVSAAPEEASILVARVGWLRLALATPFYAILLFVAATYGGGAGSALAVYGLVLFLTPFFLAYLFNGLLQSQWVAVGQAIRGATFALAVLLLVDATSSPAVVGFAEVLGAFALAVCNLVVLRNAFTLHVRVGQGRRGLGALLAQSWTVAAGELTWGVHWYSGVILLGYLATTTDTAWHSAALRLVMAVHTIVWLYLYVLLPNLARLVVADLAAWTRTLEQSLRLTGWLGGGIAIVGTLAAGTILTTVFGAPFVAAAPGLQAMVWVIPIAWTSGHLNYSLVAAQHPRKASLSALTGAVTAISLTLLLGPSLRSTGAGVALLGGAIANLVVARVLSRTVLPSVAVVRSLAVSSACCVACLVLGIVLLPVTGEVIATLVAAAALVAAAVYAERESARALVGALASSIRRGGEPVVMDRPDA